MTPWRVAVTGIALLAASIAGTGPVGADHGIDGESAPNRVADSTEDRRHARFVQVLAHNVYLRRPIPIFMPDKANDTRVELMKSADYLRGHDVVVLSEMFANGPSKALMEGLSDSYPEQTPVLGRSTAGWDATLGDPLRTYLAPEDGGVTILSKWPIVRQVQYIYDRGCGTDGLSNKGFVYVELNVAGTSVHVVGTHTQSEARLCVGSPADVRAAQFREIDAFLDSRAIPADEPVMIAGDLNVVQSSPEYAKMLQLTETVGPVFRGAPYSWDPSTNSVAAVDYQGYDPEHLDYVLYRSANAHPATYANRTLTPSSPPWMVGDETYRDYSDHYPVVAPNP